MSAPGSSHEISDVDTSDESSVDDEGDFVVPELSKEDANKFIDKTLETTFD